MSLVNITILYMDMIILHVNIFMLHKNINSSHIHIIMVYLLRWLFLHAGGRSTVCYHISGIVLLCLNLFPLNNMTSTKNLNMKYEK